MEGSGSLPKILTSEHDSHAWELITAPKPSPLSNTTWGLSFNMSFREAHSHRSTFLLEIISEWGMKVSILPSGQDSVISGAWHLILTQNLASAMQILEGDCDGPGGLIPTSHVGDLD